MLDPMDQADTESNIVTSETSEWPNIDSIFNA